MNITVVIPALNAADTIGRQLMALRDQVGAPPFDVIVVDNGSSDGTGDVAASFASDSFVLRVVHEPVRGINSARNAGVHHAADGLVLLCDADDEVTSGWVAAMAAVAAPKSWVAGALDYVTLNSASTRRRWGAQARSVAAGADGSVEAVGSTYGCCCGFWRSMWADLGGFDASLSGSGGDETEFFLRAFAAGYVARQAPEGVTAYRLRPGRRPMLRQRYRQGRNQVRMQGLAGGRVLPTRLTVARTCWMIAYRLAAGVRYAWRPTTAWPWLGGLALRCGHLRQLLAQPRGRGNG